MKTQEFLDILKAHQGKALLFEYQKNQFVDTNYHITEIKNAVIHAVDCGGNADQWNETIVQLWESPTEKGKIDFLEVRKASDIFNRVDTIHPLDGNAIVKFEYSNANFHTAQLDVRAIEITSSKVIVQLFVSETDCKAKDDCGVPATVATTEQQNACAPGSGCC